MRDMKIRSKQTGVVLVVGLLLLLVMTIIAVGAMSSTHMQERMAGNARTQALALETAAGGASSTLEWFLTSAQQDEFNALADANGRTCGDRGHAGWYDGTSPVTVPATWGGEADEIINGVELRRMMYCLAEPLQSGALPNRSQFFVANRGDVMVDGIRVATRTVEVRIDLPAGAPPPGDGCGALCFPGCPSNVDANFPRAASGKGAAFSVDGDSGPAITTGCPAYAQSLRDAIRPGEVGAYSGDCPDGTTTCPVASGAAGSPWDSAEEVIAFRDSLRTLAKEAQVAGCPNCYPDPLAAFTNNVYTDNGSTTYGTKSEPEILGDPQITFFEGDIEMGGSISGAGIMVVNGDLKWNGTPDFQGLLIVLGGTYDTSGGGQGGQPFGGSVVVLNLENCSAESGNSCFGDVTIDFTGGGTAGYNFDCDVLWQMRRTLLGPDDDQTVSWRPECEAPGDVFEPPGPPIPQIVSWRENLGWRTFLD